MNAAAFCEVLRSAFSRVCVCCHQRSLHTNHMYHTTTNEDLNEKADVLFWCPSFKLHRIPSLSLKSTETHTRDDEKQSRRVGCSRVWLKVFAFAPREKILDGRRHSGEAKDGLCDVLLLATSART